MKLWKIERPDGADYDQYDAAVVAAETEEAARLQHPDGKRTWNGTEWGHVSPAVGWWGDGKYRTSWAPPDTIIVTELANAPPWMAAGVVVASFNAG